MTINAFYVTTPIYYVNDRPHIGHAYTTIACDVMARFKAMDGCKTKFLTGTDEHGQKVNQAAKLKGLHPQDFTDEVSQTFRDLADSLNASHDDFIRTTEKRHKEAVQYLWKRLKEKGYIYLDKYAGWYAVRDEAFYAESEIKDGKAPTGAPVEWVEESSYFFKLSAFEDKLLDYYKTHPDFIMPKSRFNEVVGFVKQGLQDLSISRTTFDWGVDVPDDDNLPEKHVVYVWLDALTNYISALGFPKITLENSDFWKNAVHVVGKDILRFHAVYWPAFLMAADLPLPKRIYAHGWWTNEGQKISKSLGNVIDPYDLIKDYGLDQLRYFMIREVPFGQDGDFSRKNMIHRINGDLANDLGNLSQRVLSFVQKHVEARVPKPGALREVDEALLNRAYDLLPAVREFMESQSLSRYAESVWTLVADANKYVDYQAPWSLRKTDPERMRTVLFVLMEVLRCLGLLITPIMPVSMEKLLDSLNIPSSERDFKALNGNHKIEAGSLLPEPEVLFPRLNMEDDGVN